MLLVGSYGLDRAIPAAFLTVILGAAVGIAYAAIPSILVGASLWFAATAEQRLDSAVGWIGAGIVVGLAIALAYRPAAAVPIGNGYSEGIGPIGVALCFAAAGAAGALMFRQTMRELAGFLPPDDAA